MLSRQLWYFIVGLISTEITNPLRRIRVHTICFLVLPCMAAQLAASRQCATKWLCQEKEMPDIAAVLKEEIVRRAREEILSHEASTP